MSDTIPCVISPQQTRQESIDLLRGFALFGILLVNMEAWALPDILRPNPMALGSATTSDIIVWDFIRIFAEYKFVGLFSLLFGAGIAMQLDRADKKGIDIKPFHMRRMFWLGLFGLIHAIVFWVNEILFQYAVWGCVIYYIAKKSPLTQRRFIWSFFAIVLLWAVGMIVGFLFFAPEELITEELFLTPEKLQEKTEFMLLPLHQQMPQRGMDFLYGLVGLIALDFSWKAGGMMVLGIMFYRSGILSGERDLSWYKNIAVKCLAIGLIIAFIPVIVGHQTEWALTSFFPLHTIGVQLASFPLIFAYMSLVMIWYKKGYFKTLQCKLQSVGRMALSNYLMHTLIGTYLFYGYGLGLFNQIDRLGQLGIIVAIWVFQLLLSDFWLKHYRFGPFEWLWRSLSYKKAQTFKK